MIAVARGARAAALAGSLILGAAAAAPAAPLRHVDYRVAFGLEGRPANGTIRLDFVSAHGEGAVTVDVADDDAVPVRAKIDRHGHIETVLDQTLSDADLALLAAVALEVENLNGVDIGDQWQRTTRIPGGRSTVHYKVTGNDARGRVNLSVARTTICDNGETATWRGNVQYDANSFVPLAITLTGRVHTLDDPDARSRAVSVSLKLLHDSFSHRNTDD
jgi:hypothetical protein